MSESWKDYIINPFQTFGGTNPFSMGATKEEEHLVTLRDKHPKNSAKWININNEILAVQRDAQKAAFQGAQKGAPQSYTGKIGEPFGTSRYKSTAMFPAKVRRKAIQQDFRLPLLVMIKRNGGGSLLTAPRYKKTIPSLV